MFRSPDERRRDWYRRAALNRLVPTGSGGRARALSPRERAIATHVVAAAEDDGETLALTSTVAVIADGAKQTGVAGPNAKFRTMPVLDAIDALERARVLRVDHRAGGDITMHLLLPGAHPLGDRQTETRR